MLTIDALIGNLQTHELNRASDAAKKHKSLALKVTQGEESEEDKKDKGKMAYLTIRFQKIVR